MSAEILRAAAALMRQRAEKATPGHYGYASKVTGPHRFVTRITSNGAVVAEKRDDGQGIHDLNHLSYWSTPVAVAVADLLGAVAEHISSHDCEAHCERDGCDESKAAHALALTYLGRTA